MAPRFISAAGYWKPKERFQSFQDGMSFTLSAPRASFELSKVTLSVLFYNIKSESYTVSEK